MKINVDLNLDLIEEYWVLDKLKYYTDGKDITNAVDFAKLLNDIVEDEYKTGYEDGEDDKEREMDNILQDYKASLEKNCNDVLRIIAKTKEVIK